MTEFAANPDLPFLKMENGLLNAVMTAPIGICVLDVPTLVTEIVNDKFLEVAGKSRESILGKNYWEPFAEARAYYESALQGVADTGIPFFAQEVPLVLIRHGREEHIYVTFVYSPIKHATGAIAKIVVWVLENTHQVTARKLIEEAELKARLAIRSADLGLYEITLDGDSMVTDKRFDEIWGVTEPLILRSRYAALIHPGDMEHRAKAHTESLVTSQLDYQARVVWKDGSIRWVRVTGTVTHEEEKPHKLIGVVQDITDSVTAQQKIEESERSIRSMIMQSPVAMAILRGPRQVVMITNAKMLEVWGKPLKDVHGKPIFEGIPEAAGQGLEELLAKVLATGERFVANEMEVLLPRNGRVEKTYLNFVYEPLRKPDGSILDIAAVAIDVTDQVLARQEIESVVAERTADLQKSNAELAQFAYIASHDLQEPLRKIMIFSEMLVKSLGGNLDEKSKNHLDKINNSALRMNALVKDVLSYSQTSKEEQVFTMLDLDQVTEAIRNDFDLQIEQKGAVIHADHLPVIEAIPAQILQLFANLTANALKFSREDVPPVIHIRILEQDSKQIRIRFSDNGIGIRPEYTQQIFQIFQRLHRKSQYEGTGIGLALCKKIVVNHNGSIDAEGSSEDGAVFNITLPLKQTI